MALLEADQEVDAPPLARVQEVIAAIEPLPPASLPASRTFAKSSPLTGADEKSRTFRRDLNASHVSTATTYDPRAVEPVRGFGSRVPMVTGGRYGRR